MTKTRVVEMIVPDDGSPPRQQDIGYTFLPEPLMERKVPVPDRPNGQMPPPIMVEVNGKRYFVIGYSYEIVTAPISDPYAPDADANIPDSIYVLIVQAVPEMPSGLVRAGAGDLDKVRALFPEPGAGQ